MTLQGVVNVRQQPVYAGPSEPLETNDKNRLKMYTLEDMDT